ncbi:MAG: winged helix DNA-binding protein [Alphaproteobacteria bacterium]
MLEERTPELIERIFWSTYRGCASYSLNPAQWAALRFFADPSIDKKTSSEFAKFHQTTRGTANQTVLALIRKGYLKRDVSPNDHRSKSVSLTQSGMEALKRDPIRPLSDVIDRLEPGERDRLVHQLKHVYERLRVAQHAAN